MDQFENYIRERDRDIFVMERFNTYTVVPKPYFYSVGCIAQNKIP